MNQSLLHVSPIASATLAALMQLSPLAHEREQPTISLAPGPNVHAYEPRPGSPAVPVTFSASRTGPLEQQLERVTIFLEFWGTADTNDYEPLPRQITFPAGVKSFEFEVRPREDRLPEGTEMIQARVVPPMPHYTDEDGTRKAFAGAFHSAAVRIIDADGPATNSVVSIAAALEEVREPATNQLPVLAGFVVSRSHASAAALVRLAFAGTAGPEDYRPGETNLFFPAGVSNLTVTIAVNGDAQAESEFVIARILPWRTEFGTDRYLISPTGSAATVRILDPPAQLRPDPLPPGRSVFSIRSLSGITLEPGPGYAVFPAVLRVTRTGELRSAVDLLLSTGGSAGSSDYSLELTNGLRRIQRALSFPPGMAQQDITVRALEDALAEPEETVTIQLAASAGYGVDPNAPTATVIIRDAEEPLASVPALMIAEPADGVEISTVDVCVQMVLDDRYGVYAGIELFDGVVKVGDLFIDPQPGLAEHSFLWKGAPKGTHLIEARAYDPAGTPLTSQTVRFTVADRLTNPAASLRISGWRRTETGPLRLEVNGQPGKRCHLQSSSDLRTWTNRALIDLPDENGAAPEISPGETQMFFRLKE